MIPILYDGTKTVDVILSDKTNGLGRMADAISCKVEENRNGSYTLELEYPVKGIHYSDIALGNILKCTGSQYSGIQMFRISKITVPMNGKITVYANHISYDLNKTSVLPCSATGIQNTLTIIKSKSVAPTPFEFSSDIDNSYSKFSNSIPQSIRSILGGVEGSVLDTFGGEYEFDNLTVKLHAHRGSDRGVRIVYGKNLTDLKQEINLENFYTAVMPYAIDQNQNTILGSLHTIVKSDEPRIMNLDLSNRFSGTQTEPTASQIDSYCDSYIKANNLNHPKINIEVSFIALSQTEEYKDLLPAEQVSLCDTVHVSFPKLGIIADAKVIKTTWNVLLDRYDSIELGDAKRSFGNTIIQQASDYTESKIVQTQSWMEKAINTATALITGGLGGYIVLKQNASGQPEELLILADSDDYTKATKIWRFNKNGLGYSKNGYNGPYELAMTADGAIVADFVSTGKLNASLIQTGVMNAKYIKAGLLADGDDKSTSKNYWDLDTGEFKLSALGNYSTTEQVDEKIQTATASKVTSVSVEYAQNQSSTTAPTSGWSTSAPTWKDGYYVWQRTATITAEGTTYSDPTCISGSKGETGDTGATGTGVSAIVAEYYLSTSNTTQTGGSWSTDQPAYVSGSYYWTRSHITWTDGTATYTDPVLAEGINSANEAVVELDNSLDVEGVFNRLTNNGTIKGIYLENNQLLINADYIKSGTISAINLTGSVITFSPNNHPIKVAAGTMSSSYFNSSGTWTTQTIPAIVFSPVTSGDVCGVSITTPTVISSEAGEISIKTSNESLLGLAFGNGKRTINNRTSKLGNTSSNEGLYIANDNGGSTYIALTDAASINISSASAMSIYSGAAMSIYSGAAMSIDSNGKLTINIKSLDVYINGTGYTGLHFVNDGNGHAVLGK